MPERWRRATARHHAEVIAFPFDSHPTHLRTLATCAWKPIAIDHVLSTRGGLVLWLDAASVIHESLDGVFDTIARDGILTLAGQSPARRWCHPRTFEIMRVPDADRDQRCRAGGVLGFDASRADVRALVQRWRELALIADCIDPPGASRANHRYDQAVLTNLLNAAARGDGLTLQDDEIDISSTRPVRWVSTRNFVAPWIPSAADPLVRGWFATVKSIDRIALRIRN